MKRLQILCLTLAGCVGSLDASGELDDSNAELRGVGIGGRIDLGGHEFIEAMPVLRPGLNVEVQDTTQSASMRFAGKFLASNQITLVFDSTLQLDGSGFLIDTVIRTGNTTWRMRTDAIGARVEAPQVTMRNETAYPPPEGVSMALAELASDLMQRYPTQDTSLPPVPESYVAGQGGAGVAYPHWASVRDFARLLNRWTLVGFREGPDYDCDGLSGRCSPVGPVLEPEPGPGTNLENLGL